MALLDEVSGADPADVAWVRRVAESVQTPEVVSDIEGRMVDAMRDTGVEAYSDVVTAPFTPALGIYSVGLLAVDDEAWVPAVLVIREASPDSDLSHPVLAEDAPSLHELLSEVASEAPSDLAVVGIDPPRPFYEVVHGALYGTLGLPVLTDEGRLGFLTAGHVAPVVGANVDVGAGTAEVVFSDNRANHGFPTVCADVAVLVPEDQDWAATIQPPHIAGLGDAAQMARVRAYNRSGTGAGGQPVRFLGPSFAVDEVQGCWGEVIMSDAISIGGDSGSIVVNANDEAVGHLVGGLPGGYSVLQDVDFVLGVTATQLRP